MNILLWIVLGGFAGWVASLVMKRDDRQGLVGDIVLGIVGAVIGGFVMTMLGGQGVTGFNLYSLLVAIIGAVGVIWIARAIRRT